MYDVSQVAYSTHIPVFPTHSTQVFPVKFILYLIYSVCLLYFQCNLRIFWGNTKHQGINECNRPVHATCIGITIN